MLVTGAFGGGATLDATFTALSPTFWFEADKITGYADSAPLDTWADHSASGVDVSALTTKRPAYIASGLNGLPVVRFNGTANVMSRATVPILTLVSTDKCAIYLLMKQTGTQATNTAFSWFLTTHFLAALLSLNDTLYFDFMSQSATGRISIAQPAGWDDAWHIVELHTNAGTSEIIVDGNTLKSGSITATFSAENGQLNIGAINTTPGTPFKGDMAYIVGFKDAHDAATRARIRAAAIAKYDPFA